MNSSVDAATLARVWDVGVGGAVVQEGRVLLVRKTYGIGKGRWTLPGGFAEHDELLDAAAAREVFEETGVRAAATALIGVRTRYTEVGGAVYVIFRMHRLAGDPVPDGVEVDGARYFSAAEIAALPEEATFALSRQAALAALGDAPGLVETDCGSVSGREYRAFIAPPRVEAT